MYYYVFEMQTRTDGLVNATTTTRSTFALGLSYYYERKSKAVINTEFPSISLMLVDQDLKVHEQETIETQYVAPTTEQTE